MKKIQQSDDPFLTDLSVIFNPSMSEKSIDCGNEKLQLQTSLEIYPSGVKQFLNVSVFDP